MNKPSVLAIIPARGGSKGLPRKNVLPLQGKPLIAWTIEAAQRSKVIDRVILSSDDAEIIIVAKEYGCEVPFVRPAALATDGASSVDVVIHALDQQLSGYDYFILLQPTSPLRTAEDIDQAFTLMIEHQAESCASITEVDKSPYWMYSIGEQKTLTPIIERIDDYHQRQLLPSVYTLNGAIYCCSVKWFRQNKNFVSSETIGYQMPKVRSVDIDNDIDFYFVDYVLSMDLTREVFYEKT